MFTKGTQVMYVEIEENDRNKRFVLPYVDGLQARIHPFIQKNPALRFVRMGYGIATGEKPASGTEAVGFESVEAPVSVMVSLDMRDHPVLQDGEGRYSEELTRMIASTEVTAIALPPAPEAQEVVTPAAQTSAADLTAQLTAQMASQAPQAPVAEQTPKIDLTASLRAQMNSGAPVASGPHAEAPVVGQAVTPPSVEPTPKPMAPVSRPASFDAPAAAPKAQKSFNEFLTEAKAKKETQRRFSNQHPPKSKIDLILEKVEGLERILGVEPVVPTQDEDSVRGEDLQAWFDQHVESVGLERTFEILAGKIKL